MLVNDAAVAHFSRTAVDHAPATDEVTATVRRAVDAVADAIERANATSDQVQILSAIVRDALQEGVTAAVLATRIEQRAPTFGALGRWLNANPGLLTLLAAIVTVIAILNDRAMNAEPEQPPSVHVTVTPPDRDEVERIVEEKLRELEAARDAAEIQVPGAP